MTIRTDTKEKEKIMEILTELKNRYRIDRAHILYFAFNVTTREKPSKKLSKIINTVLEFWKVNYKFSSLNYNFTRVYRPCYFRLRIPESLTLTIKEQFQNVALMYMLSVPSQQVLFPLLLLQKVLKLYKSVDKGFVKFGIDIKNNKQHTDGRYKK